MHIAELHKLFFALIECIYWGEEERSDFFGF
jgi:hypothetical protein